jgi:hypothetical protein
MMNLFRFQNAIMTGMPTSKTYYYHMELILFSGKHLYLVKCGKQLTNRKL